MTPYRPFLPLQQLLGHWPTSTTFDKRTEVSNRLNSCPSCASWHQIKGKRETSVQPSLNRKKLAWFSTRSERQQPARCSGDMSWSTAQNSHDISNWLPWMGRVGRRWGRADPPPVPECWLLEIEKQEDTDLVESRLDYYGVKQEPYYFISHQLRFHWCFSKVKKQSLIGKLFLLRLTVLLSPRDINGITFTSHIREKSEARKMYAQAKAKGKAAGIVRYKDFGKGILHQTHS